ncbi:hypothetical protein S40288_08152 [Stachybotrys chartarum IBT 40288]|nr:hypothetical protein S40288_08152 [Stachybotrys chartarum IBT 40288]
MALSNAPRIRRTAQNTQFTYETSRRVNDVQTYPVQSPQGATILIYGHETGVTIVWRGGRRLKQAKKEAPKEKQNGISEDAVMIIDSDDDEPPAKAKQTPAFVDKPLFEDLNEQEPYPEIIQTLDLTLGTAVCHVAVMPMTPCTAADADAGGAGILTDKMVFAVSCVTNDVYLMTVPLTPPSPESKARPELRKDLLAGKAGSGAWGEALVLLSGQMKYSDGLAITLATSSTGGRSGQPVRAIVAAHTREASGTLRLWDIPLDQKVDSSRRIEPFQTEYLPDPLASISFNPSHTTQLLTVTPTKGVRIYDYALPSFQPDADSSGPFPVQGSWLLSLYQPFARPSSSRKPLLDAAWVAHGRAVLVLLADGQWGIWDLDGAVPSSAGTVISDKLKSGVRGAALTSFSVSGYVEGTSSLRSVATQQKQPASGAFAPMTPHTRRQVAASLSSALSAKSLAMVHGGIKVMAFPSTGKALMDETVALWVGGLEHVCVIPGISRFWESQLRKGATDTSTVFSAAQPVRMIKLHNLDTGLLGESCRGVGLVLNFYKGNIAQQEGGLPVDVLIQGESRLVIVREGDDGPGKKLGGTSRRSRRLFSEDKSDAIIVHGKRDPSAKLSFNLSTVKPGTLRMKPSPFLPEHSTTNAAGSEPAPTARASGGFDFASTMSAAADNTEDLTRRNVEAEMLDIMEIDQVLESMNGGKGSGSSNVFFEGFK